MWIIERTNEVWSKSVELLFSNCMPFFCETDRHFHHLYGSTPIHRRICAHLKIVFLFVLIRWYVNLPPQKNRIHFLYLVFRFFLVLFIFAEMPRAIAFIFISRIILFSLLSIIIGAKKSSYTTATEFTRISVALYQRTAIEWHRNTTATTSRVTEKANTYPKWV